MAVAGGIAGLAGFAAHSMVDDFTAWPVVMAPVVFMLAWVFTALPKNQQQQLDAGLNILWVPAGALFTCYLLVFITYVPFWTGLQSIRAGQVDQGLHRMAQAIEMDPNLTYYRVETGLPVQILMRTWKTSSYCRWQSMTFLRLSSVNPNCTGRLPIWVCSSGRMATLILLSFFVSSGKSCPPRSQLSPEPWHSI